MYNNTLQLLLKYRLRLLLIKKSLIKTIRVSISSRKQLTAWTSLEIVFSLLLVAKLFNIQLQYSLILIKIKTYFDFSKLFENVWKCLKMKNANKSVLRNLVLWTPSINKWTAFLYIYIKINTTSFVDLNKCMTKIETKPLLVL